MKSFAFDFASLLIYGAGVFTGISIPKIVSWFKAEEVKLSGELQAKLNQILAKL